MTGKTRTHSDVGTGAVLCGDRNLCARTYEHEGEHESFAGDVWANTANEFAAYLAERAYAADRQENLRYHD